MALGISTLNNRNDYCFISISNVNSYLMIIGWIRQFAVASNLLNPIVLSANSAFNRNTICLSSYNAGSDSHLCLFELLKAILD